MVAAFGQQRLLIVFYNSASGGIFALIADGRATVSPDLKEY